MSIMLTHDVTSHVSDFLFWYRECKWFIW